MFGKGDLSLKDYTQIHREIAGSFRDALSRQSRVQRLCEVGRSFRDSLWACKPIPDYLWESWTVEERHTDELMELLVPVRPDWTKPAKWPWKWPVRPDLVTDGQHCELCSKDSCNCITTQFRWDFTVAECGKKGKGLVVARVPGRDTIVFKKT